MPINRRRRERSGFMKILVINSGSSSLKFQVIDSDSEQVLVKGLCERIGIDGIFTYKTDRISIKEPVLMANHTQAVHTLLDTLVDPEKGIIRDFKEIDVIGHRLVHGGEKFTGSVVVTDEVVEAMYLYITIILSFIGWTGLARVVRGKFISLRREDFVMAARLAGVSDFKIIVKHLVPGFLSYLIVSLTLGIPGSILGETSMSYLGLGMKSPATSWGVLLKETEDLVTVAKCPWKMIPLIFVIITVLAFNFLGDGMRDAADPYK